MDSPRDAVALEAPPAPLAPNLHELFLLRPDVAFLNHGSFGARPRAVFEKQEEWRRRIEAEPVELLGRQCHKLLDQAKSRVGEFLGMRADDFGFVTNATEGINGVLRSLEPVFQPGDELLTTTHVYHAVRQAMRYVAGRRGATVVEVDVPLPVRSAQQIADLVLSHVTDRTRLLVIDHVTSPTALRFPVEQIVARCAERNVDVLVDGAHAPGMLPLDVAKLAAAYYAGNLHKWTCAPKGAGFLWVRPDKQSPIHPSLVSHFLGSGLPREFGWQGTRDISAWLTAPDAIDFLARFDWRRVMDHNHALAVWAHRTLAARWNVEPLSPADGALLGSMAAFPLPGKLATLGTAEMEAAQQRLYSEFHVEAPLFPFAGKVLIRVACQIYNTPDDVLRLASAVERLRSS